MFGVVKQGTEFYSKEEKEQMKMKHYKQGIAFCPCCGGGSAYLQNVFSSTWAVVCSKCFITGPLCSTTYLAIAKWNSLPRKEGLRFAVDHSKLFKSMGFLSPRENRCGICKTPRVTKKGRRVQECGCRELGISLYEKYNVTPL